MEKTQYLITKLSDTLGLTYLLHLELNARNPFFESVQAQRNGERIVYQGALSADWKRSIEEYFVVRAAVEKAIKNSVLNIEALETKIAHLGNKSS